MTASALAQLTRGSAVPLRLDAAGTTIAALQAGDADASAVLLVPGFTGSKEDFAPVLDPLAEAGFRAIAIDLPGQFESPGPADPDCYTPERLATVVLEIARALGGSVRLLGHSFGGLVSRAAVLADPQTFASLVLLCSGPAGLPSARRPAIEELAPVLASFGVAGVQAVLAAADEAADGFVARPAALAEFLRTRFLAGSPDMLLGMSAALRAEPDRVVDLAGTGVPVLVVHGIADDAWPIDVQADMADRLGARYLVLPDSAHSPAVENPSALVDALVDFWR